MNWWTGIGDGTVWVSIREHREELMKLLEESAHARRVYREYFEMASLLRAEAISKNWCRW